MSEHIERMTEVGEISRQQFASLLLAFEAIIAASFETHGGRMTRTEVRRRYLICEKWLRALRAEGWGVQRITAVLPRALATELDGRVWDPATEDRRVWMP
jgi:hypothetical protein